MKTFLFAAAMGLTAIAATPAAAQRYNAPPPPPPQQGYYEDDSYGYQDDGYYQDGQYDQRGYDPRYAQSGPHRYQPGDYYQGGGTQVTYVDRGYRGDRRRYRGQRCSNAGTIIGGVAGALLGGEIGRGPSRWSRRSGTGTVVGAGVGALIGSSIDQDNCDRSYGYRR